MFLNRGLGFLLGGGAYAHSFNVTDPDGNQERGLFFFVRPKEIEKKEVQQRAELGQAKAGSGRSKAEPKHPKRIQKGQYRKVQSNG